VFQTTLIDQVVRSLKPAPSDPDLLAAFAGRRDPEAFRQIVDRYAPMVGGICRRILGDEHAVEDAVQTTFLALSRRPRSVRGDALAGWLCSVARRTCHKLCRTERRRSAREAAVARADMARPIDELSVREMLTVLDEEVARLPADARSALLICYWLGEPQAEAARRLGKTPGAVKGLLERGRAKLLARLARRGLSADVALKAMLIAPAGLAILSPNLLAELNRLALRSISTIPKFSIAAGGIAMTTAIAGVGLWLAMLSAQVPPSSSPPTPPTAPAFRIPTEDTLGDPLPDSAILRLGTLRFRHPGTVHEMALSPDGKVVATAGYDALIAWDAATGKELWKFDPHSEGFRLPETGYGARSIAFTPDGRMIIPGREGEVSVRDVMTGKAVLLQPKRPGKTTKAHIKSIDVAPDGKALALGGELGVTVCDFDGKVLFEIANNPPGPLPIDKDRLGFGGHYSYAVYAAKGKTLAVVTSDLPEIVRLLDAATGEELRRLELSAKLVRLAFSPDGKALFATERDQSVRAYAVETGKRLWAHTIKLTNPYENYTSAIAVRPDGKTIAVGATDHRLYLLDASTGEETGRLAAHGWYPWGLAFTSDGATLYSSGWDGAIRRWDVAARKQLPLPVGVRCSSVVAASPDGKTVVYGDDDETIRLVDAATGKELKKLRLEGTSYNQLLFSPDGKRLAGGGSSGDKVHVAVWNLETFEAIRRWDWPKGRDPHSTVECLAFTPDGSRLAAATFRQSSARVWDIEKDREVAQLPHDHIYGLSFSPDGKTLATAGWDKCVRFWNPDTAKVIREMVVADAKNAGADTRLYAVCFAPAGGLVATADMDCCVRVWNASDLSLKTVLRHDAGFTFGAIAFSPDGLLVASGVNSGQIQVWDPRSGEKVWDRGKHGGYVNNIGFGRDSRTLISGANDGVGYLWDLRPKEKLVKEPAALWNDLGADGRAGYQAVWGLAETPDKTIAMFREKYRPEPAPDPDRIRRLIVELDDAKFAVRSAAQTELAKFGVRASVPLREALVKPASAEQRERISKLVDEIAAAEQSAEIRNRRAVAVLTWIGTPESRRLLEEWVKVDARGSLGAAAAAALKSSP
jgi:RNA polymerase sigma factor (sigma-70 family)